MNTKQLSPVAQAINPSREAAVDRAVIRAKQFVETIRAELIAADMDLDRVAPFPNNKMSREDYIAAKTRYEVVNRFVTQPATRRRSDPRIAIGFNDDGIDHFIGMVATDASADFDAYVAKLEAKVGDCVAATVDGNLWNESILTVTTADGAVERWKTQMIINVSSLGKLFNQFPTRKLKK